VAALIAAAGGTTQRQTGDSFLAVFGARQVREDDPLRAVQAALKILAWLSSSSPPGAPRPVRPRVGIHTMLGTLGPKGNLPNGHVGDVAFRLAERLPENAVAGGIVLSQDTYRHVDGFFDVERLAPLSLGGQTEPVQTFLVLRARSRSLARTLRGSEGIETDMIGRTLELERLKSAFYAVVEKGEPQVVTILGEAGIGKSRLLREFQAWLEVIPCLVSPFYGRGEAEMAGRPFALIRDVFSSRFDIQESDPVRLAGEKFVQGFVGLMGAAPQSAGRQKAIVQAHLIGKLLGFDFAAEPALRDLIEGSQQSRHQAFQSLSHFFASITKGERRTDDQPMRAVLLVLEDFHWSDDDSLDLIQHLAQTSQHSPLMIVSLARPTLLERRPGWGEGDTQTRLELEPLSRDESERLVQAIFGDAPPLELDLRTRILAIAGGNPLYIEEWIKMVVEQQAIAPKGTDGKIRPQKLIAVPPTLVDVLWWRLAGLPPLERAVLQGASVIGHVFWDDAVVRVVGQPGAELPALDASKPNILAALQGLAGKKLIYQRAFSSFAGTAEYTFKHELLRKVAYDYLPRQSRLEHHAEIARWLIERSGERITEFAGLVAVHFEQAEQARAAAEWYGQAGKQALAAHSHAVAIEHFEKALTLPPSGPSPGGKSVEQRLGWYEGLGATLAHEARFDMALGIYRKMRLLAKTARNLAAQARAWNGIAFLHERKGDNHASIKASQQAERLARRAGGRCRGDLIQALHLKGWAFYRLGDARQVLRIAAQTLRLCTKARDRVRRATSFKLYGVAYLQLGRYQDADHYFKQGRSLCLRLGDQRNAGAMLSNLGESARLRGDFHGAVELYEQALSEAREIGERPSEMIYLSNLGGARLGLGQFREAEAALRQAIALTSLHKFCVLSETYGFLAQVCLGQGKPGEALEAAERAVAIGQETENHLDLAGAWRVLGQVTAEIIRPGIPDGAPKPRPVLPLRDPAFCFAESLRIYKKIGAADQTVRTLRAWAEFEQQRGRAEESRKKAKEASRILARLAKLPRRPQRPKGG
jgi:tetratricopeptide (TPR) repeat protein